MALMIYLISNLVKLTRINFYKLILASLGNSIIKRAGLSATKPGGLSAKVLWRTKKTARQIVGSPNLLAPYRRLRINYKKLSTAF